MTAPDTHDRISHRAHLRARAEAARRRTAAQRQVEALGHDVGKDLRRSLRRTRRTAGTTIRTLRASLAEAAATALTRLVRKNH